MQPNERNHFIQTLEKKGSTAEKLFDFEEIALSYKDDSALWDFIEFNKNVFFVSVTEAKVKIVEPVSSAKEWKRIQRASDSTSIPISSEQQQLYRELMRSYEQFRRGFIAAYDFWKEGKLRDALHDLVLTATPLDPLFGTVLTTVGAVAIITLVTVYTFSSVKNPPFATLIAYVFASHL